MKRKRLLWITAIALMVLAVTVSAGVAYARYMDRVNKDFSLTVKPQPELALASQVWTQDGDDYVLEFQMAAAAENCRVFLAVSEGVTAPETLQVSLKMPDGSTTIFAVGTEILEISSLYNTFGGGYVFHFPDVLDLTTAPYTLRVEGLTSAAQEASLLRLFIEYAKEA